MAEPLIFKSLEFGDDGIAERHPGGTRAVFVARDKIERIQFERGFASERPIATLVGAALCLGGAGYLAMPALVTMADPTRSKSMVRVLLMAGLLFAFAVMFLVSLLWRGTYLRVETSDGVRKLRIHGAIDDTSLRAVLDQAAARFGYAVGQPPE